MAQRAVPAPFLTKTYQLVDDRSTDEVISWNESGTTFVVWKTADFARDWLPKYFKHNNFSSFVRQLNTYGFRKIVPDKWEFANDNFRRAHKELLSEIRRRKIATPAPRLTSPTEKSAGGNANSSTSHSGDDLGSTSTSSPESKNPGSVDTAAIQFADISGENEKLKKDNEMLSSELTQAKKQCDELIGFLTEYMKVGPDQIERIMRQGSNCGPIRDGSVSGAVVGEKDDGDEENEDDSECRGDDDDEIGNGGESLKLFGVLLKCGHNNKKRARDEQIGFAASRAKEIRICN